MLSNQPSFSLSPYTELYDLIIPKDNMLRQINDLIDFTFVLEELTEKYCIDNGRNAIPPIRMFKYLLLKAIFDVSDVDIVERSRYDMSFKYFLEMAPEDPVINPSSLTKFRRLRLQDVELVDLLINKTVEVAVEKNIITSKTLIVDATHTRSRYNQKSAKEFLQEKSKEVRKAVYQLDKTMIDQFPEKPITSDIDEELHYCRQVLQDVETKSKVAQLPAVQEKVNLLKEVIEDYEVRLNYSVDPDARKGHKTKTSSFFGYKTHIAMSDERIITAAIITPGEQSDGIYLQELISKSALAGMEIETIIGDTAYSGKDNLVYAKEEDIQLISKLHPVITHGQPNRLQGFEFNKDADTFACPAGHLAFKRSKKVRAKGANQNPQLRYFFDIEKCKVCPIRTGCYKEDAKTKTYTVTIKSNEHKEHEVFQETEEFKRIARQRYKIEAKNSELKNPHGYKTAKSSGLFGMEIQGATTMFVVNLKRIIKLLNEK